ncbi:MAG: methylmalonyl Co-A mutase-associated GTPase MeaB [Acidobacteria bacterium]|nr:MAG: methylmalonyl Co-A mutase-associated GTPase MeaB [Acidobacteriota bacterium]
MAEGLVERLLRGDVRALARAITLVEEGSARVPAMLRAVYQRTGRAYVIGITGSPGAGKSSLVNVLIDHYRLAGKRVGVIAVDPSSAFSGGAILGDRIRMQRHFLDRKVFIRSMANRGHVGGLAEATHDAVDLMDAAGYEIILLETVGVGQDEVEVVDGADTVCVILVPGMGDDIQSLKAGIMEIAHVFVLNKSDRPGVDRLQAEVEQMLGLRDWQDAWCPPLVRTVATGAEGIEELCARIADHRAMGVGGDAVSRRRRELSRARFMTLLANRVLAEVVRRVGPARVNEAVEAIAARRRDPYTAAAEVAAEAGVGDS